LWFTESPSGLEPRRSRGHDIWINPAIAHHEAQEVAQKSRLMLMTSI
jgi:hypothetical protein